MMISGGGIIYKWTNLYKSESPGQAPPEPQRDAFPHTAGACPWPPGLYAGLQTPVQNVS